LSSNSTPSRLASSRLKSTETPKISAVFGFLFAKMGFPKLIEARSVPFGHISGEQEAE
jgi:hypothetical protein